MGRHIYFTTNWIVTLRRESHGARISLRFAATQASVLFLFLWETHHYTCIRRHSAFAVHINFPRRTFGFVLNQFKTTLLCLSRFRSKNYGAESPISFFVYGEKTTREGRVQILASYGPTRDVISVRLWSCSETNTCIRKKSICQRTNKDCPGCWALTRSTIRKATRSASAPGIRFTGKHARTHGRGSRRRETEATRNERRPRT